MRKSHNDIEIRSKLWIEIDGEPVFGRGRRFLLTGKMAQIKVCASDTTQSPGAPWCKRS